MPNEFRVRAAPSSGAYRLTLGGGICFAAACVIALASFNTGNNLLFMILALLLAAFVASAVFSSAMLSGLEIDLTVSARIFAQQQSRAVVTIRNKKRLLPAYAITIRPRRARSRRGDDSAAPKISAFAPFIPARSALNIEASFIFPRRGLYNSLELEIVSEFPFGLLRRIQRATINADLLVFPALRACSAFPAVQALLGGGAERREKGSGGDLYGIRRYAAGDPAKHIDWKATARTRELKVREFTHESVAQLSLFLDCRLGGPGDDRARDRFERAVSFCASLASESLNEGFELQFAAGSMRTQPASAPALADSALAALAVIEPGPPQAVQTLSSWPPFEANEIPVVVTDWPADPIFSPAAAAGRIIAMTDL